MKCGMLLFFWNVNKEDNGVEKRKGSGKLLWETGFIIEHNSTIDSFIFLLAFSRISGFLTSPCLLLSCWLLLSKVGRVLTWDQIILPPSFPLFARRMTDFAWLRSTKWARCSWEWRESLIGSGERSRFGSPALLFKEGGKTRGQSPYLHFLLVSSRKKRFTRFLRECARS